MSWSGRAADVFATMGAVTHEASARPRLADALIEKDRRADADLELQRALAFFDSVDAIRYVREGESLLAKSA